MAKRGRAFVFHGAYGSKRKAREKENAATGRFIRPVTIRGKRRYLVLSPRVR